jgi:hypothetical protein
MAAGAQTLVPVGNMMEISSLSVQDVLLPNAPFAAEYKFGLPVGSPGSSSSDDARDASAASVPSLVEATGTQKFIEADQPAPALTTGHTVLLGIRDAFSPFAISGWFASAGYEQLLNGSPNYGTDRGAFGQRLGASVIRDASEGILSDSVMAPLLHEDPRYYRLGPGHNFFRRVLYAGTRPIITRTNSGRMSPNFALVAGNAAGSALTNLYYPQVNRGPRETMETLGTSIGGSAIGDVVGEFFGDVVHLFHGKRP